LPELEAALKAVENIDKAVLLFYQRD